MGRQVISLGAGPNDGTGTTLRDGGDMINDNFEELYAPVRLTALALTDLLNPRDVDVQGTIAIVSEFGNDEIASYDVSGPIPIKLDSIAVSGKTKLRGVKIIGPGLAYVTVQGTSGSQDVLQIDFSNPNVLVHRQTLSDALIDTPVAIGGSGPILIVACNPTGGGGNMVFIDTSDPSVGGLRVVGSWTAPGARKFGKFETLDQVVLAPLWGDPPSTTDAFYLIDFSNFVTGVATISSVALPNGTIGADVTFAKGYAHIAREDLLGGGFTTVDMRDHAAMSVKRTVAMPVGAIPLTSTTGICAIEDVLLVADLKNSVMHAYDISDPDVTPPLLESDDTGYYTPARMMAQDRRVYSVQRGDPTTGVGGGLAIVDLGGMHWTSLTAGTARIGRLDVARRLTGESARFSGGMDIGGHTRVGADLGVAGGLSVTGDADVLEDLNVGGDAAVAGNVSAATFDGFTLGSAAELDAAALARAPVIPPARWMLGEGAGIGVTTGIAPGADSIRFYAVRIRRAITITDLNARVTTAAASGNFQLAIYAAHAASLGPTGAPVYSSAGFSTTGTGAAGPSGLSLAIGPGLYWFALICDTSAATAAFTSRNPVSTDMAELVGGTTITNVLGSGANLTGFAKANSYGGGWPTLTGNYTTDSLTDVVNGSVPLIAFKA